MTTSLMKLTRTTAIALGLVTGHGGVAQAQPYDILSGKTVPACGAKGTAVDAGTLQAEAFGRKGRITPEIVLQAIDRSEVCITGKGKLRLSGESLVMAGGKNNDGTDAEVEPTVETTEMPVTELPQTAETDTDTGVTLMPDAALAAEGGTDGRTEEPAQVSEMTVTEENSRSSSEEFAKTKPDAPATGAGASSNKGLSTFEKFALGAAGIVALDAIIGRDREIVSNSGDRVVVRDKNGDLEVLRDDDTLLRRPGSDVRTETFSDGSTRTTVTRKNGSKIVTITDASGRVIKRTRITPDGRSVLLIDDTKESRPVDVTRLESPAPKLRAPVRNDRRALQAALRAQASGKINRSFTLRQVREIRQVRELMPEISIDSINFATGSAAIQQQEAEVLFDLGQALSDYIRDNPDELFLIEGHTDAVGSAASNLALSDRRAESVALALTEYFDVPPENLIIQGYGEFELLIPTSAAEVANRRAVVRRVTPLLR